MTDTTQEGRMAHYDPEAGTPAPSSGDRFSQTIMMVREAMLNPDVDANKAKVMAELMTSLEDRNMQSEFNRDLNAAIMEMPVITKDGRIVIRKPGEPEREQGRFARLEDIDRVVRPIAARHNLAYSWDVGDSGSGPVVAIILTHANGYQVQSSGMKMPLDTSGGKNNVQGAGSAVTYGKRYTLCARFNIQTEGADDDGSLGLVKLTHERQNTVLTEAEVAHAAGTYTVFFSRQSPKDRAWLISSGNHERFGGQVALPSASAPPPREDPPATQQQAAPRRKLSAAQWLEGFKKDLEQCGTTDALDEYADAARDALDRLKGADEAKWNDAQAAVRSRRAKLEGGHL